MVCQAAQNIRYLGVVSILRCKGHPKIAAGASVADLLY